MLVDPGVYILLNLLVLDLLTRLAEPTDANGSDIRGFSNKCFSQMGGRWSMNPIKSQSGSKITLNQWLFLVPLKGGIGG